MDLYKLKWKVVKTPAGREIHKLTASAPRISDGGSTGWPTPTVGNAEGGQSMAGASSTGRREDGRKVTVSLPGVAQLVSGWPTPTRQDAASSGAAGYSTESGRHSGTTLTDAARATGWATPTRDWKDGACQDANVPVNSLLGRQVFSSPAPMRDSGPYRLNVRFSLWLMAIPQDWLTHAPKRSGQRVTRSSRRLPPPS